jgi:hypothetical protein
MGTPDISKTKVSRTFSEGKVGIRKSCLARIKMFV